MKAKPLLERYAKDLMRDPFYAWLKSRKRWILVVFGVWGLLFLGGFSFVVLAQWGISEALRVGSKWVVWGGALRTVLVWHITWSVSSIAHVWG